MIKSTEAISVAKMLEHITPLITEVDRRVKESLAKGRRVPMTSLARELSPVYGIEWSEVYQLINAYVAAHASVLEVKRGTKGGIDWVDD
jgi:hypothetical protein